MRWFRKAVGDPLPVSMAGVKLGDRLLVLGSSDINLIAALAIKAGLTGRACLVEETEAASERAASAVEQQGALIETFTAPFTALPFPIDSFDVIVMRNVLPASEPQRRSDIATEVRRVVRPGGRCIVIDDGRRGGLAGLIGSHEGEAYASAGGAEAALSAAGFRGVRTLAAREGLTFVEGVKANLASQ